jgi:hypothetical protein
LVIEVEMAPFFHYLFFCFSSSKVHGINDIRQIKMHIAEPLVPEPAFEVKIAIEKLKRYKSPAFDQIPAELFQHYVPRSTSLLILF